LSEREEKVSVEGEPLRQFGTAVGVDVGIGPVVGVSCLTVAVVLAPAVAGAFPVTAVEGFCCTVPGGTGCFRSRLERWVRPYHAPRLPAITTSRAASSSAARQGAPGRPDG